MLWLGVIAVAVVLAVQQHRQRLHPLVPIAIAAVASVGVWLMLVRTAALPRSMTSLHQHVEGIHRPFALGSKTAFVLSEYGLASVALPDLRATALPLSGLLSVPRTVAWNGRALLVTWMHETNKIMRGSYAIAGPDGWIAAPRPVPGDDAEAAAYWDRASDAFVLVWSKHEIHANDADFLTLRFLFLDAQGNELRTVRNVVPLDLIGARGYCVSGGDLVATSGYSTCRTKNPINDSSIWVCKGGTIGAVPLCPNTVDFAMRAETWNGPAGLTQQPTPPPPFASGFAASPYTGDGVALRDADIEPRDIRKSEDKYSTLVRVDDGYVLLRYVTEDEARRLGHTPTLEMLLERYDAGGRLLARNGVLGAEIFTWLAASNGEVALVSSSLDRGARFDLTTLRRLDDADTVTALRERLERWGGPSPIFRGLVMLALALGPLSLFAIPYWVFIRPKSRRFPQIASALAVLGCMALAMTLTRYFYL